MTRSLKERYTARRLSGLLERARVADTHVLAEHRASQLIVEAIDDDDLEKVSDIVQKLSGVKMPQLPKLKAAIEKAEAELNRYTGGGPIAKAWSKMKSLVGVDNPVVKITAFADALEKGFSQIPLIMKNNGVDLKDVDTEKSLVQVLARVPQASKTRSTEPTGKKSDSQFGNTKFSSNATQAVQNEAQGGNTETRIRNITAQLQKALSPGGIFGAFKKVPYIDSAELANELIRAPLKVFSQVAKRINSGTKAADIAPDMKGQVSGGEAQTRGTEHGTETKPSAQTGTTAPTKGSTVGSGTTATGETTPRPQGGGAPQNYAKARERIHALFNSIDGQKNAWDLLAKKMVDAGLDPEKL